MGSTLTVPCASRIPPAGRDPGCPVFSDKGEKSHSSLISSEFIICRYLGKVFKAVGLCFFLKSSAGGGGVSEEEVLGVALPGPLGGALPRQR